MQDAFLNRIQAARGMTNTPYKILSAYRCSNHNPKVGGSPTSSHMLGWAVDILANTSDLRFNIVSSLLGAGFSRLGVYHKEGFIHVDCDPNKPIRLMW